MQVDFAQRRLSFESGAFVQMAVVPQQTLSVGVGVVWIYLDDGVSVEDGRWGHHHEFAAAAIA